MNKHGFFSVFTSPKNKKKEKPSVLFNIYYCYRTLSKSKIKAKQKQKREKREEKKEISVLRPYNPDLYNANYNPHYITSYGYTSHYSPSLFRNSN